MSGKTGTIETICSTWSESSHKELKYSDFMVFLHYGVSIENSLSNIFLHCNITNTCLGITHKIIRLKMHVGIFAHNIFTHVNVANILTIHKILIKINVHLLCIIFYIYCNISKSHPLKGHF